MRIPIVPGFFWLHGVLFQSLKNTEKLFWLIPVLGEHVDEQHKLGCSLWNQKSNWRNEEATMSKMDERNTSIVTPSFEIPVLSLCCRWFSLFSPFIYSTYRCSNIRFLVVEKFQPSTAPLHLRMPSSYRFFLGKTWFFLSRKWLGRSTWKVSNPSRARSTSGAGLSFAGGCSWTG